MAPGRRQALTAVAVAPSDQAPSQRHRGNCPHMGGGSTSGSNGQSGSTSL